MAIESLTYRIFTIESDVWSYGIFLWELFTLGKHPYPGKLKKRNSHVLSLHPHSFLEIHQTEQLIRELQNGYRMEKPGYAPNFIGEIMRQCWEKEPKDRPTFSNLEQIISGYMESSVSTYYCNLNAPYEKLNDERSVASKTERFGLANLLYGKPKSNKAFSLEETEGTAK